MIPGDEWKAGTPYEDNEDRAEREMGEIAQRAANAIRAFGLSMEEAASALRSFGMVLRTADTVRQLRLVGVSEEDALREVHDTILVASAEGRPVAAALNALVSRHMSDETR